MQDLGGAKEGEEGGEKKELFGDESGATVRVSHRNSVACTDSKDLCLFLCSCLAA